MKGSLIAPRPMRRAGIYGAWERLERELAAYFAARVADAGDVSQIKTRIRRRASACHLTEDTPEGDDFDAYVSRLYNRLVDLKNLPIRAGLADRWLAGEALTAYIVSRVRFAGEAPSFLRLLANEAGYSYEELLDESSRIAENGRTLGITLDDLEGRMFEAVDCLRRHGFNRNAVSGILAEPWAAAFSAKGRETLSRILLHVTDRIFPSLSLPAGKSAPDAGEAARYLPTPRGWALGCQLGDALIERYIRDAGRYPEAVAIVLWDEAERRSQGQSIAEFLYLMGIRPVWDEADGRVTGLEAIPLKELKRPRIHVTGCASSRFRTALKPAADLLNRAVRLAGELTEADADNFVARYMLADIRWFKAQGIEEAEAIRRASSQVLPEPPADGGIRHLPALLRHDIPRFDAVIKNEDTRATHMFCSDVYEACQGSLVAAARRLRGRTPRAYVGDSSDPERVQVRSVRQEARRLFWGEAMNPRFLADMRTYGAAGAFELAHYLGRACRWDESSEILAPWMYEMFAHRYVLNKDIGDWMRRTAPDALHLAARFLLAAIGQGRWQPRQSLRQELTALAAHLAAEEAVLSRA